METKLATLVGEWQQVNDMLLDPEIDRETVIDTLEGISGEIEMKADGYGAVIRNLEMETASLKAKKEYVDKISKQLGGEIKRLNDDVEWMKERVSDALIAIGKDKEGIKTERFEFKLKGTGGQQALKTTENVPDEFKKTTVVVENDNDKIREYLKDHACAWAHLEERGKHLAIK